MRYGYFVSFNAKLLSEIEFAKKHFDFVEITLEMDTRKYSKDFVEQVTSRLDNFEVFGHVHWDLDLSENNSKNYQKALEMIRIYKKIGARTITIHPSFSKSLFKINDFCNKNKIKLLIENNANSPFDKASILNKVARTLNTSLTLDVGHANRSSELNNFFKIINRVEHIHFHHNVGEKDHLMFMHRNKIDKMMRKLKSLGYDKSISLEMFFALRKGKCISLNQSERRIEILKQLDLINN